MHGSIWPVTIYPPSPGQVGDGELFERGPVPGVGGGANQKYLLFDFAK